MRDIQVGDRVTHTRAPFTVTVIAVTRCGDDDCDRVVIAFRDPETGEIDAAHADEFRRA